MTSRVDYFWKNKLLTLTSHVGLDMSQCLLKAHPPQNVAHFKSSQTIEPIRVTHFELSQSLAVFFCNCDVVINLRFFSDEGPCKDEALSNKPKEPIFFLIFDPDSSNNEKCCILLDQVRVCI